MKEIFEKIPSAQDVQRGISQEVQQQIESFISRVSSALERMNDRSITIQANGDGRLLSGIHGEKIKQAFREKGWDIKYYSDQRDGDYFQISMKNYQGPYGYGASQFDR